MVMVVRSYISFTYPRGTVPRAWRDALVTFELFNCEASILGFLQVIVSNNTEGVFVESCYLIRP